MTPDKNLLVQGLRVEGKAVAVKSGQFQEKMVSGIERCIRAGHVTGALMRFWYKFWKHFSLKSAKCFRNRPQDEGFREGFGV